MKKRLALSLFFATCILLALLLWLHAITPILGGGLFAIALVAFGGISRGFTKE